MDNNHLPETLSMANSALLKRLGEADPRTAAMYWRLRCVSYDPDTRTDVEARILVERAVLQTVLQEAIRARGWDLHQIDCPQLGNKPSSAMIVGHNIDAYCQVTEGQSREEALLSAYLDALGALKNAIE